MNIGDTLVYGNGEKAKVVGFPKLNGQAGVMVEPDEKPLTASDVFHYRAVVEKWLALGVWRLERSERRKA